ncbi:MAG TPA: DUF72 domain-containing protein [Polyangiaceae bacterium]|nr:DUF72 domain-containing protein [Polyangiaceae bacterium]
MRVAAGTSGFSYKEWQGSFYPDKWPASRMLEFYAEQLPTVELNNTFYRMPAEALILGWERKSPESFRFVLKAPRSMTHIRKLAGCEEPLARFVQVASRLGPKLGPLLFQLPPNYQRNTEQLAAFLGALPAGVRAAFEFRHPSWYDESTFAVLRRHNVALCAADVDDIEPQPIVPTADFGYLRLRRLDYTPGQLAAWASALGQQPFGEAYVFFKHEVKAPALARTFNALFHA